jgi:hypothetical protein
MTRKHACSIGQTHVSGQTFGPDIAAICDHGQIGAFVEIGNGKGGPAPVRPLRHLALRACRVHADGAGHRGADCRALPRRQLSECCAAKVLTAAAFGGAETSTSASSNQSSTAETARSTWRFSVVDSLQTAIRCRWAIGMLQPIGAALQILKTVFIGVVAAPVAWYAAAGVAPQASRVSQRPPSAPAAAPAIRSKGRPVSAGTDRRRKETCAPRAWTGSPFRHGAAGLSAHKTSVSLDRGTLSLRPRTEPQKARGRREPPAHRGCAARTWPRHKARPR